MRVDDCDKGITVLQRAECVFLMRLSTSSPSRRECSLHVAVDWGERLRVNGIRFSMSAYARWLLSVRARPVSTVHTANLTTTAEETTGWGIG
jgi:hypothetical protein